MNKPTVDELLMTSRPRSFSEDAQVRQQIADLVAKTHAADAAQRAGSILDPQATAIGDYLRSQDWSGIGQKVYDRAIASPYVPGSDADVDIAQHEIDNTSSTNAMAALIPGTMPANLTADWTYTGWSSDCTGDLH